MKNRKKELIGILLVIISTILWAINGNVGAYLFKNKAISPEHLTFFRLLFSGIALLSYQYIKNKKNFFKIFYNKKELIRLLYFSFFGLLAMQYGYFIAIKYSNAATATVLQSIAPFLIVIIVAINSKKLPSRKIVLSLVLAFTGAFLLITHGKIDQLAITKYAFIFGILAALGSVNYNLSPGKLQKKYSTVLIVGWAMLISGASFGIVVQPWKTLFTIDIISILGILYVVVLGTLFPFLIYLVGSKIISPQRAGILSLIEPVAATLISVVFMGERFLRVDYIGIGLVIFSLFILNTSNNDRAKI